MFGSTLQSAAEISFETQAVCQHLMQPAGAAEAAAFSLGCFS